MVEKNDSVMIISEDMLPSIERNDSKEGSVPMIPDWLMQNLNEKATQKWDRQEAFEDSRRKELERDSLKRRKFKQDYDDIRARLTPDKAAEALERQKQENMRRGAECMRSSMLQLQLKKAAEKKSNPEPRRRASTKAEQAENDDTEGGFLRDLTESHNNRLQDFQKAKEFVTQTEKQLEKYREKLLTASLEKKEKSGGKIPTRFSTNTSNVSVRSSKGPASPDRKASQKDLKDEISLVSDGSLGGLFGADSTKTTLALEPIEDTQKSPHTSVRNSWKPITDKILQQQKKMAERQEILEMKRSRWMSIQKDLFAERHRRNQKLRESLDRRSEECKDRYRKRGKTVHDENIEQASSQRTRLKQKIEDDDMATKKKWRVMEDCRRQAESRMEKQCRDFEIRKDAKDKLWDERQRFICHMFALRTKQKRDKLWNREREFVDRMEMREAEMVNEIAEKSAAFNAKVQNFLRTKRTVDQEYRTQTSLHLENKFNRSMEMTSSLGKNKWRSKSVGFLSLHRTMPPMPLLVPSELPPEWEPNEEEIEQLKQEGLDLMNYSGYEFTQGKNSELDLYGENAEKAEFLEEVQDQLHNKLKHRKKPRKYRKDDITPGMALDFLDLRKSGETADDAMLWTLIHRNLSANGSAPKKIERAGESG